MTGTGTPFEFRRQGRSPAVIGVLSLVYLGLAILAARFDAAPWILGLLVLPTLPALRDLVTNPSAGLTVDEREVGWHSGRRSASVPLAQIGKVRLDRRWDMSIRATLVLTDDKTVRLPDESLPDRATLVRVLEQAGLRVDVNPFSIF